MSGAEAPGPDAVAQAEEAKAKANEFFKTEKYPLVSNIVLFDSFSSLLSQLYSCLSISTFYQFYCANMTCCRRLSCTAKQLS